MKGARPGVRPLRSTKWKGEFCPASEKTDEPKVSSPRMVQPLGFALCSVPRTMAVPSAVDLYGYQNAFAQPLTTDTHSYVRGSKFDPGCTSSFLLVCTENFPFARFLQHGFGDKYFRGQTETVGELFVAILRCKKPRPLVPVSFPYFFLL